MAKKKLLVKGRVWECDSYKIHHEKKRVEMFNKNGEGLTDTTDLPFKITPKLITPEIERQAAIKAQAIKDKGHFTDLGI